MNASLKRQQVNKLQFSYKWFRVCFISAHLCFLLLEKIEFFSEKSSDCTKKNSYLMFSLISRLVAMEMLINTAVILS